MSRQRRRFSQSGMYHIIFRGINRQNIFEEERDYTKLIEIIKRVKMEMNFDIYAYCFMSNHVHLFLKEKELGDISKIMAKILSSYAMCYNAKYQRSGVLFSNRYKSEPIEDERYCFNLIRYIHYNPLKAGITKDLSSYPYSSYHEYITGKKVIVDTEYVLNILNEKSREKAVIQFQKLHQAEDFCDFEIPESRKKTSEMIRRVIMSEINGDAPEKIKSYDKQKRNETIKKLIIENGISKKDLERETGISRGTIIRICQKM